MARKRLFFMTKERLTAFDWKGGKVAGVSRFDANEEGREAFATYLEKNPAHHIHILTDLIEEEFRVENIPFVLGPERGNILQRRLRRAYPETPFRSGSVVGRDKEGRKDSKVLLAAVTAPEVLNEWLGIIQSKKASLAGIHSLPMLSRAFLSSLLGRVPEGTLLVSQQSGTGLRFSYFKGKRLMMSRMARVPDNEPGAYAALLTQELERTRTYLSRMGLMTHGQPLVTVILSSTPFLEAFQPYCDEREGEDFRLLPVGEVARRLGIDRDIKTPFSDSLFIQLLGKGAGQNHYANPRMRRYFLTRRVRQALFAASLLVVLSATTWGFQISSRGLAYQEQSRMYTNKTSDDQATYKRLIDKFVEQKVDPAHIRQVALLVEELQQQHSSPLQMMSAISTHLSRFPELQINKFDWTGVGEGASTKKSSSNSRKRKRSRGRSKKSAQKMPELLEMANLSGRVFGVGNDYRLAEERVNRFVNALLESKTVAQATVVKNPSKAVQSKKWAGDLLETPKEEPVDMNFSLKLGFKRKRDGQNP
ncbi:MAG: hypothetical protein HQL52_04480 [Magnetococcales bacterium]|nr:hypothetical protein [Magnetococcales bacterium]